MKKKKIFGKLIAPSFRCGAEVSNSMASGDEAVIVQGTILGEVFDEGILPPVAMYSSKDENVEYTFWLCGGGRMVEVAVSFFLVGIGVDGSFGGGGDGEIKIVDGLLGIFSYPVREFLWGSEVIHVLPE